MKTFSTNNCNQSTSADTRTKRRKPSRKNTASNALSALSENEIEQRDRETENQSHGESEPQSFGRYRDSDDTNDTHELPPSGACVNTLQKAAEMALADKSGDDPVFTFARAVKAFEITTDARLKESELPNAFNIWWSAAQSTLPPDTDREECLFLFMDAYAKVKHPLGSNVIQNALARVESSPPPPAANRYESQKLKTLVHLCYELHILAGEGVFFLGLRDAARAIGLSPKSLHAVSSLMRGLHRDGIIKPVEIAPPGVHRATRYRYVASNS